MEYPIYDHLDTIFIWIADTLARHSMVSCDYSCSGHFCTANGYKRASKWFRVVTSPEAFLSLTLNDEDENFISALRTKVESLWGKIGQWQGKKTISIYYRFTEKNRDDDFTDSECEEAQERNQNFWDQIDQFLQWFLTEDDKAKNVVRKSQINVDMILNRPHVV